MDTEPGHHLVEHEQRAVRLGDGTQPLEKARHGQDEAHVAGDRLDDDRGNLAGKAVEQLLDRAEIVVRRGQRVGDRGSGDAGRVGQPERRDPRAGLDEERIGVPVVVARELHDLRPAGERAGEADRAHRRLRPRVDEAQKLKARHRLPDEPRQPELGRARRAAGRGLPWAKCGKY